MELSIDTSSPVPPFEQLRQGVARMVARGELQPGARLATVRQLAADLGLAANTVARAYRELEADGVVSTHGRRGTFVNSPHLESPANDLAVEASGFARAARQRGYSLQEAMRLLERAWES